MSWTSKTSSLTSVAVAFSGPGASSPPKVRQMSLRQSRWASGSSACAEQSRCALTRWSGLQSSGLLGSNSSIVGAWSSPGGCTARESSSTSKTDQSGGGKKNPPPSSHPPTQIVKSGGSVTPGGVTVDDSPPPPGSPPGGKMVMPGRAVVVDAPPPPESPPGGKMVMPDRGVVVDPLPPGSHSASNAENRLWQGSSMRMLSVGSVLRSPSNRPQRPLVPLPRSSARYVPGSVT